MSGLQASYLEVQDICRDLRSGPDRAGAQDLARLEAILQDSSHGRHRLAHFLYRDCAQTLVRMARDSSSPGLRREAFSVLQRFCLQTLDDRSLAAARALASLPSGIEPRQRPEPLPSVSVAQVEELAAAAAVEAQEPFWAGRSLVFPDRLGRRLLVLKFASGRDGQQRLAREAGWLRHLNLHPLSCRDENRVPRPVYLRDSCIFRSTESSSRLSRAGCALQAPFLAFSADPGYFDYPQWSPRLGPRDWSQFHAILARSSHLLASYASQGILHTSALPLFHNRIQAARRDDQGTYLWERKGRMDRWLHSCRHPNFGLSGLRDFEHLEPYSGANLELFRTMGSQLLSLFLVAASFFRFRKPRLYGLDANGEAVDARHLFEPDRLHQALLTVLRQYFQGFVGRPYAGEDPSGLDFLVERMIEELGVDRHMEEILRREDQAGMSRADFESLLLEKGLTSAQVRRTGQGERDLFLRTGPHLGEFNSGISLPELIDFTAVCAGTCIASRHLDSLRNSEPF